MHKGYSFPIKDLSSSSANFKMISEAELSDKIQQLSIGTLQEIQIEKFRFARKINLMLLDEKEDAINALVKSGIVQVMAEFLKSEE
jgi:ABC-type Mn2+/Zn2+ transport system ATPase subunit